MNEITAEEKLSEVREQLQQEWASLQILGRALTEEEKVRSNALGMALELVDQALAILQVEEDVLAAEEEEWEEEEAGDEDFEGW